MSIMPGDTKEILYEIYHRNCVSSLNTKIFFISYFFEF